MFEKMRFPVIDLAVFLVIAGFMFTGIYLSRTDPVFFEQSYAVEDGLIEWLTVLALLAGSLICFYRAVRYRKKGLSFVLVSLMASLVLVLGAGEEISWGQRIFDIETPEYFKENNLQGETNIHNLQIGEVKVNKLIFSVVLFISVSFYLLVFPLLYKYSGNTRIFFDRRGIVVPKFIHLAGFLTFFLLAELIPHGKKAEMVEFAGAVIFFLIILLPANKNLFPEQES